MYMQFCYNKYTWSFGDSFLVTLVLLQEVGEVVGVADAIVQESDQVHVIGTVVLVHPVWSECSLDEQQVLRLQASSLLLHQLHDPLLHSLIQKVRTFIVLTILTSAWLKKWQQQSPNIGETLKLILLHRLYPLLHLLQYRYLLLFSCTLSAG